MSDILVVMSALVLGATLLLLVPVLVLAIEVMGAYLARRDAKGTEGVAGSTALRPDVAVLMPAHDEAAGIAASIASVRAQLMSKDRLLVVADNCSDDTAAIARQAGAEVVERKDEARRGKGFALDKGVRHLGSSPPTVLIVIDSDCEVAEGAIDSLAALCVASGRPVQALYLMRSPPGATLKTRIVEFAWIVKCKVRATGYHRLGLPCQLMGSGMAFPWPLISNAPLASGNIVEDLELGLRLAASGTPPLFCPRALVTSVFPTGSAALAAQRRRWEHGHLAIMVGMAPRLLWQAIRTGNGKLAAMVADVCVPPLAALVLAWCAVLVASLLLALAGGSDAALRVAGSGMLLLAAVLTLAWHGFARHIIRLRELAFVPVYVFAKLPMYAALVRKRQTEWVRTRRDGGDR